MAAPDQHYARVLVIGAKHVGKSSILSMMLNGTFDDEYHATRRADVFFDATRKLELIDTPGLEDAILDGDFKNFRIDPVVKAIINEQKDASLNPLAAVDVKNIDAYLIVYTGDARSVAMAKALRRAIRSVSNENLAHSPIFFCLNKCEVERPPHPKMEEYAELQKVANSQPADLEATEKKYGGAANLALIREIFGKDPVRQDSKADVEPIRVRAQTGWHLEHLFDKLAELNVAALGGQRYRTGDKSDMDRTCQVDGGCIVQ